MPSYGSDSVAGLLPSRIWARYWIVMRKEDDRDFPDARSGLPQVVVVEVAVLRDPHRRSLLARVADGKGAVRRRSVVALMLVLAVVGAGALWLGNRSVGPSRVDVVAREPGQIGVPARYGAAPNCLSFAIPTNGRTHGRADFTHQTRCARDTGDPTGSFRYVSGAWRPVLDSLARDCLSVSLPAWADTPLAVCLPTRADRRALDR